MASLRVGGVRGFTRSMPRGDLMFGTARDVTDRRAIELRLSRKGAAAMQASSVLDTPRVRKMLERLTPAERRRALDGLALLARAARISGEKKS